MAENLFSIFVVIELVWVLPDAPYIVAADRKLHEYALGGADSFLSPDAPPLTILELINHRDRGSIF